MMKKSELIKRLKEIVKYGDGDPEDSHYKIDMLLLEYINSKEVIYLYNANSKWYA